MALTKKEVFLASRFEEFAELRAQLRTRIGGHRASQLSVIDLNDGAVTSRPPLDECLRHVRRSEFMILLIGDTYGALAPHTDKSFTHLEYEEAIKEGSNTRVLVFAIGRSYQHGKIDYSEDTRLAAWQRQVEENHTVGFFDPDVPIEEVARSVHEQLNYALLEMSAGASQVDLANDLPDDVLDDIDDDNFVDEGEVRELDARYGLAEGARETPPVATDVLSALMRPAALAAEEQRTEALKALELDQYSVAVRHLERALDLRPLDWSSNYWLAQLYIASGLKHRAREAMKLAERAARLAESNGQDYSESAALVIAARAARLAGDAEYALTLAGRARQTAKYSLAFLEYARQLVIEGQISAAMTEIRTAFDIRPQSLKEVFTDPVFRPIRQGVTALYQERKALMAKDLADLARNEKTIADLAGELAIEFDASGKSIRQLSGLGRESMRRQYLWVCKMLADAQAKVREIEGDGDEDAVKPTSVALSFQYGGTASVLQWNKAPGDVIQPGDVVFTYRYQKSASEKTWIYRGNEKVRMTDRAGADGVEIRAEQPFVFSHLPASVEPKSNRVVELRKRIALHAAAREVEQGKLDQIRAQEMGFHDARAKIDADPSDPALMPLTLVGVVLLLIGAVGYLSIPFRNAAWVGIVLGVSALGVSMRRYGRLQKARSERSDKRRALDARLAEIAQMRDLAETAVRTQDDALSRLDAELHAIGEACAKAIESASRALKIFEGNSLRKGGMHPFARPLRAREKDIMRLSDSGRDRLQSERGVKIDIKQDMPAWVNDASESAQGARLLYVAEAASGHMVLSRRRAYEL
jgi:tetratricopeptide (TPR) repeat protein